MAIDQQIVSWGGHAINDEVNYSSGFKPGLQWGLPTVDAELVARTGRWPVLGGVGRPGVRLFVLIRIEGTPLRTLRDQLTRWFDPEDEEPQKLVIEDSDGGDDRYVYGICEALLPVMGQGLSADGAFVARIAVDGDVRWRETSATSSYFTYTLSGESAEFANGGTDETYPIITIMPEDPKAGGYAYKRWIPIRWRADDAYSGYPTDICNDSFDTQALIGAAKMQADGDDLRVMVDGVEADRWLDGIDTATTKVWVNLDFQAKAEATLAAAIAGAGSVETIDVDDASDFPSAGIVMIDSEAFTYVGKNNSLNRLTGVTRAVRGTSMAAHTTTDTVWWVQHDVWILYGNGTVGAPVVDDDYQPAFELDHSTNTSWVYEEFGEDDGLRTGAWAKESVEGSPEFYTANHRTNADPWEEMGIYIYPGIMIGRWRAHNPCGITNANFTNGEKWGDVPVKWTAKLQSSGDGSAWTDEYTIPDPGTPLTWEAWSRNEALAGGARYVGMFLDVGLYNMGYLEVADCSLTLDAAGTPAITIGGEQGAYDLDAEIENTTTGDAIRVVFTMGLDEELEIDTDGKTVRYLEDGSSQFQALTLVGGPRREWLPLAPGINTIQYTETGLVTVRVTMDREERDY